MHFIGNVLDFPEIIRHLREKMREAPPVRTERWQGRDVSKDPAATSYELRNVCFEVDLGGIERLEHWREQIGPNLPWADDHFLERVGGEPLNPGEQWANWPWAPSADRFRAAGTIFNHSYMERLWPKWARQTAGGKLANRMSGQARRYPSRGDVEAHVIEGIAFQYGDLWDMVELLAKEPNTRQAWIPLFFPEDTGYGDGGRKPCTLGYQIMVRDGKAHMWYPLRSCDLIRHFQDDCYLAVRLLLWIVVQCRQINPDAWDQIVPGTYAMHATSLHIFENDRRSL
jgi:hypothetical protein